MSEAKLGEWFWRFLAGVMMFSVAWTVWIIYQLNPPPLIMNAAFEAAASAKEKGQGTPGEKQSTHGVIAPSGAAAATRAPVAVPAPAEAPKVPPVNPEKLKFSETIVPPVPTATK